MISDLSKNSIAQGKMRLFGFNLSDFKEIKESLLRYSISGMVFFLSAYIIFIYRITGSNEVVIILTLGNQQIRMPVKINLTSTILISDLIKSVDRLFSDIKSNYENSENIETDLESSSESESKIKFEFDEIYNHRLDSEERFSISQNSINLIVFSFTRVADKYYCYLKYDSSFFSESVIKGWSESLKKIISASLLTPQLEIGDFNILSDSEIEFYKSFNDTQCPYEQEVCIHDKLRLQAEISPDMVALYYGSEVLTYRDLDQYSNALANLLIDKGVKIGDRISVCLERGFGLIISIYGILKAGAIYLPVSTEFPVTRIKEIFEDARPKLVLASGSTRGNLPGEIEILDIELFLTKVNNFNCLFPDLKFSSREVAYIIYTSGTTGKPKGVMIEHHSVLNRIGWMQKSYPLLPGDILIQKTAVTFDVSVWELFWWSFSGAGLVLLEAGGEKNPESILKAIENYKITTIHFVPSMFNVFIMYLEHSATGKMMNSLKTVFCSGESLTDNMVSRFYKLSYNLGCQADIVNLYGPTEATVDVSVFKCPRVDQKLIPIGKPIDNTELYVVNDLFIPQKLEVPGEILICGINLARGYFNNYTLTQEKFVEIEIFGNIKRAYRTGDLAYLSSDGNIYFIGRIDNQVKLRGMRIELGEIESKTVMFPGIMYCIVLHINSGSDSSFLAAFYQKDPNIKLIDSNDIRTFLKEQLPAYEIPSVFREINEIPLSANGKVDKKALVSILDELPFRIQSNSSNYYEKRICLLWQRLLRNDNFDLNSNFFEVGGNSLILVRLLILLKNEFDRELDVLTVLNNPTINSLAKYLSDNSLKKF